MLNKRLLYVVLAILMAVSLVPATGRLQAQQGNTLTLASGVGDIPTLDPQLAEDTASHQVVTAAYRALINTNEEQLGNVYPAMAESWKTSEDGKTYTFTIRKDVPWVKWDGSAVVEAKNAAGETQYVNANDFEYAIKRLIDPRTASPYAYVFVDSLGIVGAADLNSIAAPEGKDFTDPDTVKKIEDAREVLGVKALDANTLEIKIKEKIAYAVVMFGMWPLSATPKAAIDEFGDKWTEPGNAWSYGPYTVSEWKHDESLTMVANPHWVGMENSPKASIEKITFLMIDSGPAMSNYEANTLDVVAPPLSEMDRVKADATLSKELVIAPQPAIYYYGFNVTKAPFDDARVRRAFSMAVDRQSLIDNVTKGGQLPARWFVVPGLAGAPTIETKDLGINYDPEGAKKELQSYLDEKKITVADLPPITLMANQVEGHIKIAEAIQAMWKDVLGVEVTLTTQEWKVFLQTLKDDAPQIWRNGWNFDYGDANNFNRDVMKSTSSQNYTKWANAEYDKLVDEAALETDNAKRVEMYSKAEQILVNTDAAIIPIYWYTRVTLTKPYITRTFALGGGDERFEKWSIKQ